MMSTRCESLQILLHALTMISDNTAKYSSQEMVIRDMVSKGKFTGEEPKLPLVFANPVRVAKEGDKPTVDVTPDLGTPVCSRLYENIKKT